MHCVVKSQKSKIENSIIILLESIVFLDLDNNLKREKQSQ